MIESEMEKNFQHKLRELRELSRMKRIFDSPPPIIFFKYLYSLHLNSLFIYFTI